MAFFQDLESWRQKPKSDSRAGAEVAITTAAKMHCQKKSKLAAGYSQLAGPCLVDAFLFVPQIRRMSREKIEPLIRRRLIFNI